MGLQKWERVAMISHERKPVHKTETESELLLLELPLHILYDILSRLTFESIFWCRCVCKKFHKLLTDPYFSELHLTKAPDSDYSTTVIVQDKENASDLFLAQFGFNSCTCVTLTLPKTVSKMKNTTTTLVASCNGLLCIRYARSYYVCNPILGEFMVLPHDTPSSLQPSAFGYCPKTKEYKVIRFVGILHCKIHTLGTSNWRILIDIPLPENPSSFDSSLNGNLHWITKSKMASNLICSFSLETEQFLFLSPPTQLDEDMINRVSNMRVGACAGLFSISYMLDPNRYEIWVMKNYGIKESWIKKIKLDGAAESSILNYPLKFLNNGDLLIKCHNTTSLCSLSTEKDESRVLMDTGIWLMSVMAHLPSFISLQKYGTIESVEVVQREKTVVQKGEGVRRLFFPSNSLRRSYTLLS